jgi:HlyD family secretion protein
MFLAGEAVDIRVGNEALVSGDILDDSVIRGRVKKVFPQAVKVLSQLGVEQQRVPVEIELLESHQNLRPGFGVDVEVITGEAKDALLVPSDAVFEMDGRDYVFVVEDKKAVLRQVNVGLGNRDWTQILDGLSEKETVIVDPPKEVEVGTRIK